ncbi:DGQHR domain-containing protein [Chloroflexota bacterium]
MNDKELETSSSEETLTFCVIKGQVLGVDVYRGYGRLCDLANISKADIFDQRLNPTGTQRDLNPKHARNAYNYVREQDLAFWPEVFLCARNKKVISYKENPNFPHGGLMKVNIKAITDDENISISRVDGNHRLHFAGGNISGFPPIEKQVSFCLSYNLDLQQEIKLFRDINDNQRRMNTSHLDNIEARLTPEAQQKRTDPALYMAKKLGADQKSPFFDMIYEGGPKPGYFVIPLRSLKTGIKYMLSQPGKLTELEDPDAQYTVIRNFFSAVKTWQPEAWKNPKQYLILRGAVLWGICYIGSAVIDKTLSAGKYLSSDMVNVLKSGPSWDWSKSGDFAGLSGAGGSMRIRDMVVREFADQSGISIKSLAKKILGS